MKQKLQVMLQLQDQMNQKIHPQWREQEYEWYRAIWIECAELMDHYGWKWWKKQSPDRDQVLLELIDIWHFGLGQLLQGGDDFEKLAAQIQDQFDFGQNPVDFKESVESFASAVLSTKSFDVKSFCLMMLSIDLRFDALYQTYIGKNVLNFFRQDHGYKEGRYQKLWNGREDNEHLVEVLGELSVDSPSYKEDIYKGLAQRYPS